MAKKGKTVQIWIDYRILAWTAFAVISGLLLYLIITTISLQGRIDSMTDSLQQNMEQRFTQLEIGADIVCDIFAKEHRDDSRESRRKDSQRDSLLNWLEAQGYGEQAREFLKQCEDSSSSPVE